MSFIFSSKVLDCIQLRQPTWDIEKMNELLTDSSQWDIVGLAIHELLHLLITQSQKIDCSQE
jgi:hypothetical protein